MASHQIDLPGLKPEAVLEAILTKKVEKSIKWLDPSRHIRWRRAGPGKISGKVPFRFEKYALYYRFYVEAQGSGSGSTVTVRTETTILGYAALVASFCLGLLMCGVGVILSFLGMWIYKRKANRYSEAVAGAISKWAESEVG